MKTNSEILDGALLDTFCKTWIGSGDENPEIVFIGEEFSSEARSHAALVSFFSEIENINVPTLISNYYDFVNRHTSRVIPDFNFADSRFGAKNTTRKKMCMMAYCLLNKIKTINAIDTYADDFVEFSKIFASQGSKTAALEIFPLPCKNSKEFQYSQLVDTTQFPQFKNKEDYKEYYTDYRIKALKFFLGKPSIKYVIVYSKTNYEYIHNRVFEFQNKATQNVTNGGKYLLYRSEQFHVVYMNHFAYRFFGKEYINEILNNFI